MICNILAIIVLVALYSTHTSAIECNDIPHKYLAEVDGVTKCLSCKKCPPGSYVSKPCKGTQDTECSECPDGFYNTGSSRSYVCKPCTQCPPHLPLTRHCNRTQNAKCGSTCDIGYYRDQLTLECRKCSWCFVNNPVRASVVVQECVDQGMPEHFHCMQSFYDEDYTEANDPVLQSTSQTPDNVTFYSELLDHNLPRSSHHYFSIPSVVVSLAVIGIFIILIGFLLFRQSRVCAIHKRGYAAMDADEAQSNYSVSQQDVKINVRTNPFDERSNILSTGRYADVSSADDVTIWDSSTNGPGRYGEGGRYVEVNSSITNCTANGSNNVYA